MVLFLLEGGSNNIDDAVDSMGVRSKAESMVRERRMDERKVSQKF